MTAYRAMSALTRTRRLCSRRESVRPNIIFLRSFQAMRVSAASSFDPCQ